MKNTLAFLVLLMFSSLAFTEEDLHIHVGGSVDIELLKVWAKEDNVDLLAPSNPIGWFAIVHQLINTVERIEEASKNVIDSSSADYLEIRSTPRVLDKHSTIAPYVAAFASAIRSSSKAKGILSIDRFQHDFAAAMEILDEARKYPDEIVAIDISGYKPGSKRKLVGADLAKFCDEVLKSKLGLAIHMGEFDNQEEIEDSTRVLGFVAEWVSQGNNISGRFRLGHCIFLNDEHRKIINKLRIPVEICPTGHKALKWWDGVPENHPVFKIYDRTDKNAPIVLGTDDTLVFNTNFKQDSELFNSMGLSQQSGYAFQCKTN